MISEAKAELIEAAYAACASTLAARRQATSRWWEAKSPWASFRARCTELACLGKVEQAQQALSAAWDARI